MSEPSQLGKYNITSIIGRGAMGIVYKAHDSFIDRTVALKTIKQDCLDAEDAEQVLLRFKTEAQAAGRLSHPNIVTVYEYGEENNTAFIAMEYVEGRTLREAIANNERFPLEAVVDIIKGILDGLAYAHEKGVIHRDIKPDNIILLKNGRIKITDFGIARIESSNLTQHGDVLGTPSYMSPEQCTGTPVDNRSDIFSTGAILYHLLTGEKAFPGDNMTAIMHRVIHDTPIIPSELNLSIYPDLDQCVFKSLAKNPGQRFQNAEEFSTALTESLETGKNSFVAAASSPTEETVLSRSSQTDTHRRKGMSAKALLSVLSRVKPIYTGAAALFLLLVVITIWMTMKKPTSPEEQTILAPAVIKKEKARQEASKIAEQDPQDRPTISITSKPSGSRKIINDSYQETVRGIRPRTD
ncbi:MAG: protein kinase [Desulfovibrionaceae bacterium]|nr:protein kinase [Desulfovibrionaceae bacterium]